jgi:hypothetical protein
MRKLFFSAIVILAVVCSPAAWAKNEMRFLPDVITQFNDLSVRPDPFGFFRGSSPDPELCKHYQGMVRVEAADGTPYFIVTRSGVVPDEGIAGVICFGSDDPGNLLIVRLGSRDKNGERLRSNRLHKDRDISDTAPPSEDTTVNFFTYDGTVEGFPNYGHPGGMQVVDNVLVVPLESPYGGGPDALFMFYDISDPEHPVFKSAFDPQEEGVKSGSAGITPLANGHYMLVVTGGHNEKVWFYESLSADGTRNGPPTRLNSPTLGWFLKDIWQPDIGSEDGDYLEQDWPNDPAHQTLQFLRQGDINGPLYLAGAHGVAGDPTAEDIMDLYRVDTIGDQIRLKHVSTQFMDSHPNLDTFLATPGNNVANFAAASTFYISPSGELLFYCTEHDNDGPDESVKAGEWRHVDIVRHDSPTYNPSVQLFGPFEVPEGGDTVLTGIGRPPITKAWIQLFSGFHFTDRYIAVDFEDWAKESYENFSDLDGSLVDLHAGFTDEPSSWKWFAPKTCSIRANDDDFGDDDFPGEHTKTLDGTGGPEEDENLRIVRNDSDSGSMDDELSSVEFRDNCSHYYSAFMDVLWDLDRNGTFETNSLIAPFSGAGLDGPSDVSVPVQARHPDDGRVGNAVATVHVTNVPPIITDLSVFDSLGLKIGVDVPFAVQGVTVTAKGTFTDPGTPDHQTATLHYGDGLAESNGTFDLFTDAFGGVVGRANDGHRYAIAGDLTLVLDVLDDDGGARSASLAVKVLTPAQAVDQIIILLDQLIAGTTNDAQRKALLKARKDLAGSPDGRGLNGALDAIKKGDNAAAIVKLQLAITDLQAAQAAGANVGNLIALLRQVMAALLP